MKPVYLEFCGVNSFSEKAVIDFKKLFTSGLFGIFGDTGSGKSTILDCIQLALYGNIDRSSESECINRKSEGFYIVYDFELLTNGVRKTYRVRRERTRKSSGNAKAYLYEWGENNWLALAEGTRDVNAKLGDLIGLSVADFRMCIALPQGEFAGLVKAKPAERLALVSRLFDLGKYGERLKFYLKEKCGDAAFQVTVVETKLAALDDCSDERREEVSKRLAFEKETLAQAENRYADIEKRVLTAESLLAEKNAYEKSVIELEKAEKMLPVYEEKRKLLEVYPILHGILEKSEAFEKANAEHVSAEKSLETATVRLQKAALERERARRALEQENYDEKIAEVSRVLGRFESAKADIETCKNAEEELMKSRAEYASIKATIKKEPYDEMIAELTLELEKFGEEETVVEYVKKHLRTAILLEGYGHVRSDLRKLAEKYPETANDVSALIEKYTLAPAGSELSFDIASAEADFKIVERERKRCKEKLLDLEKKKRLNDENESKLRIIEEKGKVLKTSYEAAKAKIETLEKDGTLDEVTARLEKLKLSKKRAEEALQKAQEEERLALSEKEKYGALKQKCLETRGAALLAFEKALKENGFTDIASVRELLGKIGDEKIARADCDKFFVEYVACKKRVETTDKTGFERVSEEGVYALKAEKRSIDEEKKLLGIAIGKSEQELKKLEETKVKFDELNKEYLERKKQSELWERLRSAVSGRRSDKTLMDFVATEYLQDVCLSAGKTLLSLTGGRYFLKYQNGEFFVGDNLDGGELRAVRTLSGGETFLVSLSLALSLSAAICQSLRPMEFFFLDEGFGTLDSSLVDTVMDVLGRLSKDFTIGLISHVEELKHRIENKILVTGATESHGSQIRMECF